MKADEYYDSIKDDRNAWQAQMKQRCMLCHVHARNTWPDLQIHEIRRRSQAPRSWGHRCNYLLLCQQCHDSLFAAMPAAAQLLLKRQEDPVHYNLPAWRLVADKRGRAVIVLEAEIEEAASILKQARASRGR